MSKFILFTNGNLSARYDSTIHGDAIPAEAIEVSDELFFQTINENDGTWVINSKGKISKIPFPQPTLEEQTAQAVLAVRSALQSAIDKKAVSLGFSKGDSVIQYAGYQNRYQPLALIFGGWEADVWGEADDYKAQVLAGNKPMLLPEEAVAMMPSYPS